MAEATSDERLKIKTGKSSGPSNHPNHPSQTVLCVTDMNALLRCLLGPREDALIPGTRNSGVFCAGVIFYAHMSARKAFAFCAVDQFLQVRIVGAPECCAAVALFILPFDRHGFMNISIAIGKAADTLDSPKPCCHWSFSIKI
jgi:hypothetical protein